MFSAQETINPCEPSGTLTDSVSSNLQLPNGASLLQPTEVPRSPNEGDEQALESHEVIELQAFSERKAWIEDKIKFLEKMPPIEVFVGLDAVRSSAEEVPGLPTRAELKQWLVEHDIIEKETEIFDSGELKKLKKFTKAATQRNLSPEDTDLIELTLTTIYELDKLLHLLRDRSENLDLLGVRLTWEEYRTAAWVDRRTIIADLATFLEDRARWSPSIYETMNRPEEPPITNRRGSIASIASVASVASDSSVSSAGFSRSARFKLAELLSRDAAQFAGRVTSLRHGKIAAAGKALDKLIDNSRKPVPEELLDEQDTLEDKGINDLEQIGKFVMNVVMQWRKADEIYVETMKDLVGAQNLLEEIETAKLHHPTARQSIAFVSRADGLIKRLALRGNPASSTSAFPCPVHPLFPDQKASNESLARILSTEIAAATDLARKVDSIAKEYRSAYEAVKRVETLTQTANALSATFITVIDRLEEGVSSNDGDGTPPNLMSESCLDATRHSVFLALLPSILEERDKTHEAANQLLRSSQAALLGLDRAGIDPIFKTNAASEVQHLSAIRDQSQRVQYDVVARVGRLRQARRIWAIMDVDLKALEDIRRQVGEAMERQRWRKQADINGTPLTPESPLSAPLVTNVSHPEFVKHLDDMHTKLLQDVDLPLASLSKSLEAPLNDWLTQSAKGLKDLLESVKQMTRLLESIQNQTTVMSAIRDEFNDFQIRIEDLKIRFNSGIQDILGDSLAKEELTTTEASLEANSKQIQDDVQTFIDSLSQRVVFVAQHGSPSPLNATFVRRRFSSGDLKLGVSQASIELPFDLFSLDDTVRADSNSYAMRLGGELDELKQKGDHFQLARMAKDVDFALSSTVDDINHVYRELSTLKSSLLSILDQGDVSEPLQSLFRDVEASSQAHRARIARSFSPIRKLLRQMESAPGVHDASVHEILYLARTRTVDDAELRFNAWNEDVASLRNQISEAQRLEAHRLELERLDKERLEQERLEQERIAEELRIQVEMERIAAEEAEKSRLERERLEAEEKQRLEEMRLAEERRLEAERERIAAEEAEKSRLERERLEAVEKLQLEEARLAEEARLQAERERIASERAETARLERKRLEEEEKQRREEERLAEERQLQFEREQIAAEKARLERQQSEFAEKLRTEEERMATERRLQAERERAVAEEVEKSRLEREHFAAKQAKMAKSKKSAVREEDVFGLRVAPSSSKSLKTPEMGDLQAHILSLRKRLRSININEVAHPGSKSTTHLPSQDQAKRMNIEFSAVSSEVDRLPDSAEDSSVDLELRSLKDEVQASIELMERVRKLANLSEAVRLCDAALSDLLEHIDSYPAPPLGTLSSAHRTPRNLPPEEQLSVRLTFTKAGIDEMTTQSAAVADDPRATAETNRILQTWSELEDMGNDRIGGRKSRPASVISSGKNSSGRNSSTSVISNRRTRKSDAYSNLSIGSSSSSGGRFLAPSNSTPRRAVSGSAQPHSRPPSQMSTMSSNRSASGPFGLSIYGSTFASRQRTTSLTTSTSTSTPVRHPGGTPLRSRAQTGQSKRSGSPSVEDAPSHSHSILGPSRSSTSMSTWSRAPRHSLSTLPKITTPQKKSSVVPRKTYIADPKSKLDVAVGDVVNKLPVNINIEGVAETWRDQSGKYWIGDQDPKLCFCRILRSQTVMVRVGGGWSELSKFIKDHFADSFRIISESPPRPGAREEKWISSSTLLEAPEIIETPPLPPRTPEPKGQYVPSFSLSTPSGHSPHSLRSTPSTKGSPLTPLQFMRRADPDALLRPITPSKPPTLRPRNTGTHPPARNSVWRP